MLLLFRWASEANPDRVSGYDCYGQTIENRAMAVIVDDKTVKKNGKVPGENEMR